MEPLNLDGGTLNQRWITQKTVEKLYQIYVKGVRGPDRLLGYI